MNDLLHSTDYNSPSERSCSNVSECKSVKHRASRSCTTFDCCKKDHLSEWKLEHYNRDPLQWHECIGHYKKSVNSAPLSNVVKLMYLETLVMGKAKTAIDKFANCGTMYQTARKTLERKFGQPHAVASANLD